MPRRVVSTSGSSGMVGVSGGFCVALKKVRQGAPCGFQSLLNILVRGGCVQVATGCRVQDAGNVGYFVKSCNPAARPILRA